MGSQSLLHYTGQFTREWLAFENIQLVVIMIGVALCVPTEVSPITFAEQTLCRTLILGALACLWIHAQLRSSAEWIQTQRVAIRQLVAVQLWNGGISDADKDKQRSRRSGRGGRGNRSGSTPRGQGSSQISGSMQRAGTVTPGMSGVVVRSVRIVSAWICTRDT